ncbi:MAG: hypothetical protein Q8K48_06590 [Candidatus Planktophila sp.]|nr:hypothetical protein [Candidatus Planktophila sp.]
MNMLSKALRFKAGLATLSLIASTLLFGNTFTEVANAVVYCPAGYTVSGNNCTITTTYSAGSTSLNVEYLVVAGGGGSGSGILDSYQNGGGGGGGGYLAGTTTLNTTSFTVTVGAGGAGGLTGSGATSDGQQGGNSVFTTFTAIGGGFGGGQFRNGGNGGSGGGGGSNSSANSSPAGSGVAGQGNAGNVVNYYWIGGAGGGAGAAPVGPYGDGGAGITNSITGTAVEYARGGQGSSGGNGTANTGKGGANLLTEGGITKAGGNGGSGIVVLKYLATSNKINGGTATQSGAYFINTFTTIGTSTISTIGLGCAEGDTLSGSTCTNVVSIAGTNSASRCPAGSYEDPNDVGKCILEGGSISAGSTVTPNYSCPNGYGLTTTIGQSIPECVTAGTTYAATVSTIKTCPSGGTLVNNDCVTSSTYVSQNYTATTTVFRTCPNGGTLGGTTCYVSGGSVVRAYQGTSYGTPSGYYCSGQDFLAGDTCYTTGGTLISSYTATTTLTWACPDGYFPYFSECWNGYQTASHYYITNVSCPNGGTLSGTTCNVYSVSTSYSASVTWTTSYYCPEGGDISGTTCTIYSQPTSYESTLQQGTSTCPNGGTLNGTICINGYTQAGQTYTAIVTTNYSCPNGGTLTSTNCVYQTSTITIIIKYSGSCPTNYKFNSSTLLCDPVPYPYVNGTAISLAGVYLCLTYSYGNLIETKYYTYDATNSTVLGSLFERKCVLESGLEANVSSESGFYYCEIINKVTQEMTTVLSPTDITGFRTNKSTTCILRDDVEEPAIEVYTFEYTQQLIDTCATIDSVSVDFAVWIACQILRNA